MKRGEMPRHIRSKIFCEPFGCAMQVLVCVVLTWNEQRGDLKPDIRFVPEISQCVQHRLKLRKAKPMIKRIGERLQIYVRRVHVSVKLRPRIVGDVAGGDRNRFDPAFATRLRNTDRVLGEKHRIMVSECTRPAAESLRRERDLLSRCSVCELVPFARFRDVPVLTKPAPEIASGRAK